jgi:ribosomal protein L7/L12
MNLLINFKEVKNGRTFYIGRGLKIAAIKECRAATGQDLKKSKAHVDKLIEKYSHVKLGWIFDDEIKEKVQEIVKGKLELWITDLD